MNFTISSQLINAPFKPREFGKQRPGETGKPFRPFLGNMASQKGKETVVSLIDFHGTHKSLDKHE